MPARSSNVLTSPTLKNRLAANIEQRWYSTPGWLWWLLPLEGLFRLLSRYRKKKLLHQNQKQHQKQHSLPVVVVGNISVGGTGKTPVIIALIKFLREQGYKPAVVSRGYGRSTTTLQSVDANSTPSSVGDEPLEIYWATQAPVVVNTDRVQAVDYLSQHGECDIVLADDGLQHYALKRDIEIAVLDGEKLWGNGHCLPVGPLREPVQRLKTVDHILVRNAFGDKTSSAIKNACTFTFKPIALINVKTGEEKPLTHLFELSNLYAVAGIGNPQKFFGTVKNFLEANNKHDKTFDLKTISFPDHHPFSKNDFDFIDGNPIVMTEKDAVKCKGFAEDNWWGLKIEAVLTDAFYSAFYANLKAMKKP